MPKCGGIIGFLRRRAYSGNGARNGWAVCLPDTCNHCQGPHHDTISHCFASRLPVLPIRQKLLVSAWPLQCRGANTGGKVSSGLRCLRHIRPALRDSRKGFKGLAPHLYPRDHRAEGRNAPRPGLRLGRGKPRGFAWSATRQRPARERKTRGLCPPRPQGVKLRRVGGYPQLSALRFASVVQVG